MPATLASLPAEIHARIAAMCALQDQRYKAATFAAAAPTFSTEDPRPLARLTTVAALSVLSKYWNKVTEPYRFWRLKSSHLVSHKFRLGFGQKYGRYITELDLSDLGYRDAVDPTMVFAALPLLPNVHTVVTPVRDDVDALVANNVERDGGGPRRYGGPEVEFVRDAMYKLCASVPSLVVYLLVGHESIIDGLAKESPQTEQLVLYDHEDADASQLIDVALDALLSCPRLAELQLVMYEELDVHQPLRRFRLPPECNLRCLSLSTFGQCTASLSELVDKLAPVLQSLELEFDQLSPAVADMFAGKVDFPRLETLDAPYYWPQHDDMAFYSRDVLEPLLDRMRDMLHQAVQTNDYVQVTRVARALQLCELLRIERDT